MFHGVKWSSTLDLKSGYRQVEVSPVDREKMAFTVGFGLWQLTLMPFGLCNSPSKFEHLIKTVLCGSIGKICLVYLDDVVIFGSTVDELLQRLCIVFEKPRGVGLKLSPQEWQLVWEEVRYLRFLFRKKDLLQIQKRRMSCHLASTEGCT